MLILDRLEALGTHWWIDVYDVGAVSRHTGRLITEVINEFERHYSRFREESVVATLNRNRIIKDTPAEFREMIMLGQEVSRLTGNAFTLGLGGVLEHWGYDRDYRFTIRGPVSFLPVKIAIEGTAVRLGGEGNIDLGGIGKGYLIRKIALRLRELGIMQFMINGGGDVYATSNNGNPVKVYLQHPNEEDTIFADVMLRDSAVCVSSPFKRSWQDEESGKVLTHIINPRDPEGDPTRLTSSVVIGQDPAISDALATAFCILGEEECRKAAKTVGVRYRKIPFMEKGIRATPSLP